MGGRAVDDPGAAVCNEGYRLHGGGVGQAEKDQVGLVKELFPLGSVLPLGLVDEEQLNILPLGQPVINLQAGGALFAVDVDFGFIHRGSLLIHGVGIRIPQ